MADLSKVSKDGSIFTHLGEGVEHTLKLGLPKTLVISVAFCMTSAQQLKFTHHHCHPVHDRW